MILCTVDTVCDFFVPFYHPPSGSQTTHKGYYAGLQISRAEYDHKDNISHWYCYVMYFTFFFVEAHPHPIPPLRILALTLLQILHQNRHLSCVSASVPPSVYVFPSFLETEPLGCRRRNRKCVNSSSHPHHTSMTKSTNIKNYFKKDIYN